MVSFSDLVYRSKPERERIARFIAEQSGCEFSYRGVGTTRDAPDKVTVERGYWISHHRYPLGRGEGCFARAREQLLNWGMFKLNWVELCWPTTRVETGATVAILGKGLGVWTINACKVIYQVEEESSEKLRCGFAYGTLPGHTISGEERFQVEIDKYSSTVWYDVYSFSRPNFWVLRVGEFKLRDMQRRFAADSGLAMVRQVSGWK